MNEARFLRRDPAAKYLKETYGHGSPRTLAKLASIGGGPRFHKSGRLALYTVADLDDWALSRISPAMTSTSDISKAA